MEVKEFRRFFDRVCTVDSLKTSARVEDFEDFEDPDEYCVKSWR
jgi:hypothetical protein